MFTLHQALKKYFKFDKFREGQEEVINYLLKGKNVLLVMPTGSGKSLAYQLPAILLPGLTLVISPLIALMKDQVDHLIEADIPATYINSSLPTHEVNTRLRATLEGHVKLLYIAPERLRNRQFTSLLARIKISMLAIDEAHCISQWGHDFRPDYLHVGPIWQAMGKPTLLATTATATATVRKDILNILGLKKVHTLVTGFNRPNLSFRAKYTSDAQTRLQTLQALLHNLNGSAIIYTATRRNCEEVAEFIRHEVKLSAQAYHAGLDSQMRYQIQTNFMADRLKIVVATNAFGMGIDKSDIRLVIHYNMPATIEAYYQEAGRAGRDGKPAECILFYAADDQQLQEWMINSDTPTYQDLQQVYLQLTNAAEDNMVNVGRHQLEDSTGLHPVKLRVTLSELEIASVIYHMGSQRGFNTWKILPSSSENLEQALQNRAKAIQQRTQIRHNLLEQILKYVNLSTCRREFLLNYFGDKSPPKSPHCCDNHNGDNIDDLPKAVTAQEWYPIIILETVRSLSLKVGRSQIAKLLAGSQSKKTKQLGHDKHKFYAKLAHLKRQDILDLIDQIIEARYLSLPMVSGVHQKYTVLDITPLGLTALQARVALPIQIENSANTLPINKKSINSNNTVLQTLSLLEEGLTPAEIATQREFTQDTIYKHLAELIAENKVAIKQVIPSTIENQVLDAVKTVGNATRLKPLKTILPESISYEQIKCVLAAHPNLPKVMDIEHPTTQQKTPAQDTVDLEEKNNLPTMPHPTQTSPSKTTPSLSPDQIIVETVAKLGGTLGRTGLAQFLTGSKQSWLKTFMNHSYYGKLSQFSQKAVLDIIDALIADEQLKSTGGRRPKVVLGKEVVENNVIISSTPPEHVPQQISNKEIDNQTSPQTAITPQTVEKAKHIPTQAIVPDNTSKMVLEILKTWRLSQSKERGVAPFMILPNKVLDAISTQCPTTLADLNQISGIGPAKLSQYGEAIINLVQDTLLEAKRLIHAQADNHNTNNPSSTMPPLNKDIPKKIAHPIKPSLSKTDITTKKAPKKSTPDGVILAVVTDLDGLITPQGLSQLLTAAPGDIVPFSDNDAFGKFNGQFSKEIIEQHIEKMIKEKKTKLSRYGRLTIT